MRLFLHTYSYTSHHFPQICPSDISLCVPYYLCGDGTLPGNQLSLDDPSNPCPYLLRCCPLTDVHADRITEAPETDINVPTNAPTIITTSRSRPFTLKPESNNNGGAEARPKCGIRNKDGLNFRISDSRDNEAEFGEFPWMVAVFEETEVLGTTTIVYKCGGSAIHPKVILTAAHCVNRKRTLIARAGEWDTQTEDEIIPRQDRKVAEVIVHEGFHKGGLFNDIALLVLETPFATADNVGFVCLPKGGATFDSLKCTASGWGSHTIGGVEQTILKKVDLPIVPRGVCQDTFRALRKTEAYELHESYLCAGGQANQDTCKGDGGSPLVCPTMATLDQYVQAGIVSWGRGCGSENVPGVYANVAVLRDWIDMKMSERQLDTFYYQV